SLLRFHPCFLASPPLPPPSPLFPYTTLFRSVANIDFQRQGAAAGGLDFLCGGVDGAGQLRVRPIGLGGDGHVGAVGGGFQRDGQDRKSTRLSSSHVSISYAVFCLKKKEEVFI